MITSFPSTPDAPEPARFHGGGGQTRATYERHRPEETVLYGVHAEHWRSFLSDTEAAGVGGSGLPRFVTGEVEAFLKCGILAHGFLRVACDGCRPTGCRQIENGRVASMCSGKCTKIGLGDGFCRGNCST